MKKSLGGWISDDKSVPGQGNAFEEYQIGISVHRITSCSFNWVISCQL